MSNGVSSLIDLNDSEILKLEKVIEKLNEKQGSAVPLEAFRRDCVGRFEDAGFRVDVKVYDTNVVGVFAFDIEIQDRYEGQFDPDRQVWEATSDILELGEGGVIKTEKTSSGIHVVGGKCNHCN